jgi:hypothetical protein
LPKEKDMTNLVNVLDRAALGQVTKKVPFIEGAEVIFLNDVPGNFLEQLKAQSKASNDTEAGYWATIQTIVDWNFSGTDGKKLAISVDNFKKLPLKLQKWMLKMSGEVMSSDEERKKGLPANS